MTKDNAFRELKFSPPQLIIVFLAVLVLGVFVFLLGISVGKKQPQLLAQAGPGPALKTESAAPPVPKSAEATTSITPALPVETTTSIPAGIKPGEGAPRPKAEKTMEPQSPPATAVQPKESKSAPAGVDKNPAGTAPKIEAKKPAIASKAGYQSAPYYIQVSASEDKAAAAALAKKIATLGYPTIVLDPLKTDKTPLYRVRVGPFESKQDATTEQGKIATSLKKKKTDFFIVKG
jgi:DedD protein